jgi:hypothetical protein
MASLVRYVAVPGNIEELLVPTLIKEIVVDDLVVSAIKTTFLEAEIYDQQVALDYVALYRDYVSTILDALGSADTASSVSYDYPMLIKLATSSFLDMVTIPSVDTE